MELTVRYAEEGELSEIMAIHRAAFMEEDVAGLTADLLADPTAQPVVSLVAFDGEKAIGHILFTAARFEPEINRRASILAPLGVLPDYQRRGVGKALVKHGMLVLTESGVELLFVLGHPDYYPVFGFMPAGKRGFAAPYPIEAKNEDAWMVTALSGAPPDSPAVTVKCAATMDRPEYWRE